MSFNEKDESYISNQYISQVSTRKTNYSVSPGSIKCKKIGDYILLSTIGSGTFSTVKLGIHLPTQQKVAIKILDKNKINDENDIKRMSREIHILSKLNHPNIAQLYETMSSENHIYIIMEYIEGHDLFQYIYSLTRLTELKASKLFRQLISCLEYIHILGIVHRDIKPENILLNKKKTNIKLVDFGLSNSYRHGSLLKTACGSPCYASPEMISGKEYDPLYSDLWSCGVVLYCMLVGKLPFDDEDIKLLYHNIKCANYFMPLYLSNIAQDILRKILNTNPNKRIRIDDLKRHPFFLLGEKTPLLKGILVGIEDIPVDIDIVKKMKNIYFRNNDEVDENFILSNIKRNEHNNITVIYALMVKKYEDKNDNEIYNKKIHNINQMNSKKENSLNNKFNNNQIIYTKKNITKNEDKNINNTINAKFIDNNQEIKNLKYENNTINVIKNPQLKSINYNDNDNENEINDNQNKSINESSQKSEHVFNVNNIKRINFNSNDLSLKSNSKNKDEGKYITENNMNPGIDNRFNVVVINNIMTDTPSKKDKKTKVKNAAKTINTINSSKSNNNTISNSKTKQNHSKAMNINNKNVYSISVTASKRARSNNCRIKNKTIKNYPKMIVNNKKYLSRNQKTIYNANSKNKKEKNYTININNNNSTSNNRTYYLNTNNNNNTDYISNDRTTGVNSIIGGKNKIKVKEKQNINLKKINFKFANINYMNINNNNNNHKNNVDVINKVNVRKVNIKKTKKYNDIIKRNEQNIFNNYNNLVSKTNTNDIAIQNNKNYINENIIENNKYGPNRIGNNFNKTFSNEQRKNIMIKTDNSFLKENKNNYLNYINDYKNNGNPNNANININCNNNVNIYINKNNRIKNNKKYYSCNNKNKNKICFNDENLNANNNKEKYNNILGFTLNNTNFKERNNLNYKYNIDKRNNNSSAKKDSKILQNLQYSHSNSKDKNYNINILFRNDNKHGYNNTVKTSHRFKDENQFKINRNNSFKYNQTSQNSHRKIKIKSPQSTINVNKNDPKISFASPINFNRDKINDNIQNLKKINASNNIGVSVNFSNIIKKSLSKRNVKNKDLLININHNIDTLNTINNCLNTLINNDNYLQNKTENPFSYGAKKLYSNTNYSTGKKSYNDNKSKKIKCLSFNKTKQNSIGNINEKYYNE